MQKTPLLCVLLLVAVAAAEPLGTRMKASNPKNSEVARIVEPVPEQNLREVRDCCLDGIVGMSCYTWFGDGYWDKSCPFPGWIWVWVNPFTDWYGIYCCTKAP
ncbi:uncharacterized protein LOC108678109 [Hyalella azteca]|uniref:Uncharacterized protein LOC108678109 n=1 Tax=Hyalella azteca TaxID=294128 RepID=A0A8B7P800_HYAAZ|nr:uncharacterized protein LOC108678109 [Hyalella azteca]